MESSAWSVVRRSVGFALGVGLIVLEWGAITHSPRPSPRDGAIDQVFGSRPVLIALRVGLVVLTAYVVSSVVALMLRGRWLTNIGPRGAEVEPLGTRLVESNLELVERIEDLEASLEEIGEVIDAMQLTRVLRRTESSMRAMGMTESERREKVRMHLARARVHLERARSRGPKIRRLLEEARQAIEHERRSRRAS